MKVLIVFAHPEPTSFCAALRQEAVETIGAAGQEVIVSDLYAESFNPVAGRRDFLETADAARFHYQSEQLHAAQIAGFSDEIVREHRRVEEADAIVFLFPLWWGGPPAILKGWIDRVLAYGFAYVDGARFETGLFSGKRSLLCVTTGGTRARFTDDGAYGEIERVLWPVQRLTLDYMGVSAEAPFICYGAPRVGAEGRADYLAAWRTRLLLMLDKGPVADGNTRAAPLTEPAPWARNI
ncbi:NAD(P)H-dependent oxidoreductase [Neorhizobium vignae]|uniref:NAD(P)H-dependent oxidoreductase n=1 Tax=Neorhizobium vignae TaxID=690585 RepID=UPI00068A282D|nr:NAD(P)H-dependent oxidoreductase [Neorhizobium vignae]